MTTTTKAGPLALFFTRAEVKAIEKAAAEAERTFSAHVRFLCDEWHESHGTEPRAPGANLGRPVSKRIRVPKAKLRDYTFAAKRWKLLPSVWMRNVVLVACTKKGLDLGICP